MRGEQDKEEGSCARCFNCNKRSRNKLPKVTLLFWFIKIAATTLGELMSDALDGWLPNGYSIILSGAVFAIGVPLNVVFDHYIPALYWFTISIISVVGTQLTDMTDYPQAEVPIGVFLMAAIFFIWYRLEGTLAVSTVFIRRREAWYWLAVVITFTTGTAVGDFMADDVGLSYWQNTLFFFGLLLLVMIIWLVFKLNDTGTFWVAYIITRPLGTAFGDYLEKFLKPTWLALIFLITLMVVVIFLTVTKYDVFDISDPEHADNNKDPHDIESPAPNSASPEKEGVTLYTIKRTEEPEKQAWVDGSQDQAQGPQDQAQEHPAEQQPAEEQPADEQPAE